VVREALDALRDGRPRLIALAGEGGPSPGRAEGMIHYPMTCHSGGTLEIYVEPYLPEPLLLIVGHGPVVEALAALAQVAGYSVELVAADALPDGLGRLSLTARSAVVVATHADADEEALAQVLGTDAGYVSLVASRRRAALIAERLRQRGVAPERVSRLKAPAGLDIGAETPPEIAVSILAEIVQHQRSGKPAVADPGGSPALASEAIDPICGMRVEVATARHHSAQSGRAVYFCCRHCKDTFDRDPDRYRAALGR